MIILGIETSCDETGVALFDTDKGRRGLLLHKLHSQVNEHAPYGGILPELAARSHVEKLDPLVADLFLEAKVTPKDIGLVAATATPGLLGALLVGTQYAVGFASAARARFLPVHHMEAHLYSVLLDETAQVSLPCFALLVSGGHTQLLKVRDFGVYELLGQSLDDAAGEAFDKVAKMLGLGYPGGARLSTLAQGGDPDRFPFSVPMKGRQGLDFSFSGLKTAVRYAISDLGGEEALNEKDRADLAASFEAVAVSALLGRIGRLYETESPLPLIVAGGVAANRRLHEALKTLTSGLGVPLWRAPLEFSGDNGAMIALLGALRARSDAPLPVGPRCPMPSLSRFEPSFRWEVA